MSVRLLPTARGRFRPHFGSVTTRNASCRCFLSNYPVTGTERTYYVRRALQEERAAAIASCQAARDRHQELARAYRAILRDHAIPRHSVVADQVHAVHAVGELQMACGSAPLVSASTPERSGVE